jgi:glutaredoxin
VNPKRIRLFVKPYCSWCHRAQEWLATRGITYTTLDVIADPAAFDEMRRLSGQTLAPVIEVDGQILADFGPDELAVFWERLARDTAAR